jgi:hypothetical protein
MKKTTAFVILSLAASGLVAGSGAPEQRYHYSIVDKTHSPLYQVTAIARTGEESSSQVYLLKSAAGERLRIDVERDFKKHETTAQYYLDDRRAAKVKLTLPFAAGTLHGTISEKKSHPELNDVDVPVTVESAQGSVKTSEKEWKRDPNGAAHSNARRVVDAALAATVKSFAPVLAFPMLSGACSTLPFVTDGQRCVGDARLAIGSTPQDCAFDAEFGMPCTGAKK